MVMGRPFNEYGTQKRVGARKNKVAVCVRMHEKDYRDIRLCAETLGISMADAIHYLMHNGVYYDGSR